MSTQPVDPEDNLEPEEVPVEALLAEVVMHLFRVALKGEITRKQALEQVARRELAQMVTPVSVRILVQVLPQVEESGEPQITEFFADLLVVLADTLSRSCGFESALELYTAAEPVYHRLDREPTLASCQMNRAITLAQMGQHAKAVAGCDAAEPIFHKHGLEIEVASCQLNRANMLRQMGQYAEAEALLQRLRPRQFSPAAQMFYHSVHGEVLFHLDRHDEAFKHFERGRSLFRYAHHHGGLDERHLDFSGSFQAIIRDPVHFALRAG